MSGKMTIDQALGYLLRDPRSPEAEVARILGAEINARQTAPLRRAGDKPASVDEILDACARSQETPGFGAPHLTSDEVYAMSSEIVKLRKLLVQ